MTHYTWLPKNGSTLRTPSGLFQPGGVVELSDVAAESLRQSCGVECLVAAEAPKPVAAEAPKPKRAKAKPSDVTPPAPVDPVDGDDAADSEEGGEPA